MLKSDHGTMQIYITHRDLDRERSGNLDYHLKRRIKFSINNNDADDDDKANLVLDHQLVLGYFIIRQILPYNHHL